MQSFDELLTCTSTALGDHLSRWRFDGNADATAKFLRAAADTVIAQSIVATENAIDIGECLHDNNNNDDNNYDTDNNNDGVENGKNNAVVFVSSLQPRGKLQLKIGTQGTRLGGGDQADTAGFMLKPNTVKACVVFPKPEECKKAYKSSAAAAPDMVCLALTEAITYKNKQFTLVCFQLPAKPKKKKKTLVPKGGGNGGNDDDESSASGGVSEDHTSKWMVLLQQSLAFGDYERVYHPKNTDYNNLNAFQSHRDDQTSSTSAGMPYVTCYCDSVNDGVVFPLHTGALLFYKPVQLWTKDDMVGPPIVGNNSSRYIGLSFQLKNKNNMADNETKITGNVAVDLTNISAHERNGLEAYVLDAFGTTKSTSGKQNKGGGGRRHRPSDGGDDDDDDDGAVGSSLSHEEEEEEEPPAASSSSKRTSRKRKAAVYAAAINKRVVVQTAGDDEDEEEDPDATFDDDEEDNGDDDDDDDEPSEGGRNKNDSDKTDDYDDDDDDDQSSVDKDSDGE